MRGGGDGAGGFALADLPLPAAVAEPQRRQLLADQALVQPVAVGRESEPGDGARRVRRQRRAPRARSARCTARSATGATTIHGGPRRPGRSPAPQRRHQRLPWWSSPRSRPSRVRSRYRSTCRRSTPPGPPRCAGRARPPWRRGSRPRGRRPRPPRRDGRRRSPTLQSGQAGTTVPSASSSSPSSSARDSCRPCSYAQAARQRAVRSGVSTSLGRCRLVKMSRNSWPAAESAASPE